MTRVKDTNSIPVLKKFGYSIGHTLNDLTAAVWFSYLITYFDKVRGFDSLLAGYLMLVGQVADALFTPLIGLGSDRYAGCCLGKRKSWHLIGACFIVTSFPLIFIEVLDFSSLPQWTEFTYYAVAVSLFQFGWASVQVSHLAMIPELTECQTERVQLNGLRYAVNVASTLFVYLLAWLLFYLKTGSNEDSMLNEEDSEIFKNLAIIVVCVGVVASILFYVLVREVKVVHAESNVQIVKKWSDWLKCATFYKITVIYMCTRIVVNISQIYIPIYITESLSMKKESIAIVPLVVYISGFITSLLMSKINKRLGRKKTYCIGQLCTVGACVWIYFIHKDIANQIYGVATLIGIGGSTVLVTSLAMTSDLIGNNVDSGAFVYGCVSFADKLGNGVAIILIQRMNSCNNHSAGDVCTDYYRNVLIGVPGGVTVVAFMFLLTLMTFKKGKYKVSTVDIQKEVKTGSGTNKNVIV